MRRLFSASGGKENTSLNDKSDRQKPEQGEWYNTMIWEGKGQYWSGEETIASSPGFTKTYVTNIICNDYSCSPLVELVPTSVSLGHIVMQTNLFFYCLFVIPFVNQTRLVLSLKKTSSLRYINTLWFLNAATLCSLSRNGLCIPSLFWRELFVSHLSGGVKQPSFYTMWTQLL